MRKILVEDWTRQLRDSFGSKAPIDEARLRMLYDSADYAGMVGEMMHILSLDLRLRLGLVRTGGRAAPAWIETPLLMPMFGTQEFRQMRVTMYLRNEFIASNGFEQVVNAIAHELCHVVLNSTMHALRHQEEAVDLTAMLLGFRDFYVTGCRDLIKGRQYGYLTFEEVSHAAWFMTYG